MKSNLFIRTFIVLFTGFVIRFLISCNPSPPQEMEYNNLNLYGIDNSGMFLPYNKTTDTLYSEAVAIKITIFDSVLNYCESYYCQMSNNFAFTTALAWSYYISYKSIVQVTDISVKTLFDINDKIKAGDEISDFTVYSTNGELYSSKKQAILFLNGIVSDYTQNSVMMVLTEAVKNANAQFEVTVSLDNGTKISKISNLFTIINPKL